jgi:ABC-2 type transport system permease protein
MSNVWTIARKELRGYFDHPTAYILLVVFLGINFFFYFRSAFLIGEASLRPLFDLLSWILLFFVPAVTMGALAEEKRHGTLEVTLSHPIREHEFLLGKYVGNVTFVAIALTGTLLLPMMLAVGGDPDGGVVVAQYIGSLLLVAGMVAVGLFASALTRNQITAFIVGTAVMFILMMVGTEVVQIGMPSWLVGPLGQLGILPRFANVARGVIDLRDLVYFASLAAAFLALAYWLLLRDRLSHGSRLYRNLRIGTATIVAIAVFANLFGRHIPGRVDLTSNRLYTLSDGTRQILGGLNDLVTITFFTSSELPAQFRLMERDVNDVLRDFERFGRGNVQVVRVHPDASEEARQEAQQLGIAPVQFNVIGQEELQVKQGWMGLAMQYAGASEVIPFVGNAANLEYQLASNAWRLTRTDTATVAFIIGHGERSRTDYSLLARLLGETYEVTTIDLSAEDAAIDPGIDAVIIAGPRDPLDARPRQLIREYLQNDGRAFYLGEGADVNLQYLFASAVSDSSRDFSEQFGVRVNGDLVFDMRSNESMQVPGEVYNYIVPYPFWLRALPAGEHAITRGLNSFFLPWASSLDTLVTRSDRVFTPLITTSPYAGRQMGAFQIRPDADIPFNTDELQPRLLAVAVQGAVGAAPTVPLPVSSEPGDSAAEPQLLERNVSAGPAVGRVVVVGDSDFLIDQFARSAQENLVFALNAIDWLTQSEALLGIRSKQSSPRPLRFESSFEQRAWKYINLIGVPLAFVLFGALRLFRRRRMTRQTYAFAAGTQEAGEE